MVCRILLSCSTPQSRLDPCGKLAFLATLSLSTLAFSHTPCLVCAPPLDHEISGDEDELEVFSGGAGDGEREGGMNELGSYMNSGGSTQALEEKTGVKVTKSRPSQRPFAAGMI